ncbi:MAG TPA: pyruvate, phosphate dikinase [Acidimicrobiales bacterium]|nr:pyruvate, phosphate dikinase [Acidimicrobiales bacterium]
MSTDSMPVARWVYSFDELDDAKSRCGDDWDAVRGLLGGKGANLADMASLGVPVPPGFTVTTEACNAYIAADGTSPDGMWDEVDLSMKQIEHATGKGYGDPDNPLLVSVRSGAKFSMPGMMDTVLNVGLNDETAAGMIARTGDARFVLDSYRRLVQMFGTVVLGCSSEPFERVLRDHRKLAGVENDADLPAHVLRETVDTFKAIVDRQSTMPFPTDPVEQLRLAIEAVFGSWNSRRAHDYRKASGISADLGTAVNVVAMVYGNTGSNSATGVVMSRDATTGARNLEGDFLVNAQGEDVVAGNRPTQHIDELADEMPVMAAQLTEVVARLEQHYGDMQDVEFTVEDGKLWLLQTRTAKRTAQAAVRIAVDQVTESLITREEAVARVTPEQVEVFLHPQFAADTTDRHTALTRGLNVSPGAAVGVVALDPDLAERWAGEGREVLLVRTETKPDDVHGMLAAVGILTSSGGRTSHAALVARQFGKPAVTGATDIEIDMTARTLSIRGTLVHEGEWLSIDGTTGDVFGGQVETVEPDLDNEWLSTLLGWADGFRRLEVRANVDEPEDALRARAYGATGIGLCRTEHMFFGADRLPIVQRMIMAPTLVEQREAIDALLEYQRADFAGLFRAMDGLPVIIRLLDPPLHEFLPSREEMHRTISDLQIKLVHASDLAQVELLVAELSSTQALLARVDSLHETNPMLGLRGVRLGLRMPHLTRMQAQAIFEAALEVADEGGRPMPEIMIPLVSHVNELARQREVIEEVATEVIGDRELYYEIGTMIEVPRAALTADQIAEFADFLSFGTNDLTQTTFGISRDDAEAAFLLDYLAQGILSQNPFSSIDAEGVGQLMRIALEGAKSTKPGIGTGVCGEHGGDPASIAMCHDMGLDYVSCSAYRIPVARLAAAQAALVDGP